MGMLILATLVILSLFGSIVFIDAWIKREREEGPSVMADALAIVDKLDKGHSIDYMLRSIYTARGERYLYRVITRVFEIDPLLGVRVSQTRMRQQYYERKR